MSLIVCNVTPATHHIEETHNTLRFATRAALDGRAISTSKPDKKTRMQKYEAEIEELKRALGAGRNQRRGEERRVCGAVGVESGAEWRSSHYFYAAGWNEWQWRSHIIRAVECFCGSAGVEPGDSRGGGEDDGRW